MLNVADLDAVEQARSGHDAVEILVLDDDTVKTLYGRPPVVPYAERCELISHVRGVSAVRSLADLDRLSDEVEIMTIAGEPVLPGVVGATAIVPERRSMSSAVRSAIAPVTIGAAVA